MDLSRFANTTVKKPKLVDLMNTPCFKEVVQAYDGNIDDQWIIATVFRLLNETKVITSNTDIKNDFYLRFGIEALKEKKKESYSLSKANQYLRKHYSELYYNLITEVKCEI